MTVLERLTRLFERRHHVLAAGGDRNRFHQLQEVVERPVLVVRAVDEEANESLHAGADKQTVHVREVIADEQRGTAKRHVLLADDADAIDRVRQQPQAEADQELGHDREDVHA